MDDVQFDWDERKARSNLQKHGVSFEEAKTVFADDLAIEFYDEAHSEVESRFLLLGSSVLNRVLLVCHCERSGGSTVRIISARKATASERSHYVWRKQ